MNTWQLVAAIVAPLLALFGALGGVVIGHRLRRTDTLAEREYLAQKSSVDARIKVLERTAAILNKSRRAQIVQRFIQGEVDEGDLLIAAISMELKKEPGSRSIDLTSEQEKSSERKERMNALTSERESLNSEFGTVAALAQVLFGPKTKAALLPLAAELSWFDERNKDKMLSLLGAMQTELFEHGK